MKSFLTLISLIALTNIFEMISPGSATSSGSTPAEHYLGSYKNPATSQKLDRPFDSFAVDKSFTAEASLIYILREGKAMPIFVNMHSRYRKVLMDPKNCENRIFCICGYPTDEGYTFNIKALLNASSFAIKRPDIDDRDQNHLWRIIEVDGYYVIYKESRMRFHGCILPIITKDKRVLRNIVSISLSSLRVQLSRTLLIWDHPLKELLGDRLNCEINSNQSDKLVYLYINPTAPLFDVLMQQEGDKSPDEFFAWQKQRQRQRNALSALSKVMQDCFKVSINEMNNPDDIVRFVSERFF